MKKANVKDFSPHVSVAYLARAVFELAKLPPNVSTAKLWLERAAAELQQAGIEVPK